MGISVAKYKELTARLAKTEKELEIKSAMYKEQCIVTKELEKRLALTTEELEKIKNACGNIIQDYYILQGKVEAYEKVLLKKDEAQ